MPSPKPEPHRATRVPRQWTTVEGAAGHLGCSTRTIRRMISRGEITGYRLGNARMIRLDVAELDQLARPIAAGDFAATIGRAS